MCKAGDDGHECIVILHHGHNTEESAVFIGRAAQAHGIIATTVNAFALLSLNKVCSGSEDGFWRMLPKIAERARERLADQWANFIEERASSEQVTWKDLRDTSAVRRVKLPGVEEQASCYVREGIDDVTPRRVDRKDAVPPSSQCGRCRTGWGRSFSRRIGM